MGESSHGTVTNSPVCANGATHTPKPGLKLWKGAQHMRKVPYSDLTNNSINHLSPLRKSGIILDWPSWDWGQNLDPLQHSQSHGVVWREGSFGDQPVHSAGSCGSLQYRSCRWNVQEGGLSWPWRLSCHSGWQHILPVKDLQVGPWQCPALRWAEHLL